MRPILSLAVLAFVAYDFVLLSRMRKALNASMAALDELEALMKAPPTKVSEIVVDMKIDASQASEVLRDLTNRIAAAQKAEPEDTRPFGVGPCGMRGPRGTVFEPSTGQFVEPPEPHPASSEAPK